MTRIKMCGLCREEDIEAINGLFLDYVGFVFDPESSCYVTPERAVALKEDLDEDITVVGVFADAPVRFVAALMNEDLIDIAQLNGSEDETYIADLRRALRAPDEKAIIQTYNLVENSGLDAARQSAADMVLLGIGKEPDASVNWNSIQSFDKPYFLSGDVNSENVGELLTLTGAAYVDVCSGIETDGKKDPKKMKEFIQAVHRWDSENPRLSFLESLHPEYHGGENLEEEEETGFHPELN